MISAPGAAPRIFTATDLDRLASELDRIGDVAIVVIDPIPAYPGGHVDSHRTGDVRALLERPDGLTIISPCSRPPIPACQPGCMTVRPTIGAAAPAADADGDNWPEGARRAATAVTRDGADAQAPGILLLADLRELFAAEGSGVLFTTPDILSLLHNREDCPYHQPKIAFDFRGAAGSSRGKGIREGLPLLGAEDRRMAVAAGLRQR